jgi:hypothetical protein
MAKILTRNFVVNFLAGQEFIAESGAKSPHSGNFTGTAANRRLTSAFLSG